MALDDVRNQRQPETRSRNRLIFPDRRSIELLDDPRLFSEGNADSAIRHLDKSVAVFGKQTKLDVAALTRILHRVGQQVENCLFDGVAVGIHWGSALIDIQA